ncbi:hypothetical protein G6514_008973 [Epicoccum nigrum]|nr:hypothetical protein G6514_008973 [Epicoccum nigrum]
MSYADVAASGPKQSAEEVSTCAYEDEDDAVFANMRTGQCSRAPPVAEIQPSEESVSSLVDVDSPHVSSVPSDYESQSVKTDTQAARQEREEEIKEAAKEIRDSAAAKKDKAKDKVRKNADNPVVLSNAVGLAVVAAALSFGAYRKHSRGELTGKVVAAWAGVVGLFGLGDYYVSQYFFKRYPPKN